MECRSTPLAVVAVLIVVNELIWGVLGFNLVLDLQTVPKIADAKLHEDAAVGVRGEGEQFSHFTLELRSALEKSQRGGQAASTNHLSINRGDSFSQKLPSLLLDLVAEDEVAIGGENPTALGLVDDAASNGVGKSIVDVGVKPCELGRIGHLDHGDRDGFLGDVPGRLGDRRQGKSQRQREGEYRFSHDSFL